MLNWGTSKVYRVLHGYEIIFIKMLENFDILFKRTHFRHTLSVGECHP